jgi:hypothetical protein
MANMDCPFETFGFATAYDLGALPDWSGSGVHQFQRQQQLPATGALVWNPPSKHRDVLIEVTPDVGDSWVGCFHAGLEGVTGIFATPSPQKSCVVVAGEGYWVTARSPSDYEIVRCVPIKIVRAVPEKGVIVFGSFTDLAAYGAMGLLWETPQLSWDGLKITEVTEKQIRGLAWDSPANREVPFVVDVETGRHQGGSSPEAYLTAK